jgi:hypothetical protein
MLRDGFDGVGEPHQRRALSQAVRLDPSAGAFVLPAEGNDNPEVTVALQTLASVNGTGSRPGLTPLRTSRL